jgi:hypothetical protein
MIQPAPEFFTAEDLSSLTRWANKRYEAGNEEHVAAKDYLLATVWLKTAYWARSAADQIMDFDTWNWRMWSKRDWIEDGGKKILVTAFKPYTWARIYRDGQKDRSIFFTVGVDTGARPGLLIKMDYMYEGGTNLSHDQMQLCEERIRRRIPPLLISPDKWKELDWTQLLASTVDYVNKHTAEYDSIVADVWGGRTPKDAHRDTLFPRDLPKNGYAAVPEYRAPTAEDEVDFFEEMKNAKELGDAGEALVVEYERWTLRIAGFPELAEKVEPVKDGRGFDVLSFNPDSSEKHIEVKTTRGNWKTPFFMSRNERRYLSNPKNPVVLYRLYRYNDELNTAEYFTVKDIEAALLFDPTAFVVYPKKKD